MHISANATTEHHKKVARSFFPENISYRLMLSFNKTISAKLELGELALQKSVVDTDSSCVKQTFELSLTYS